MMLCFFFILDFNLQEEENIKDIPGQRAEIRWGLDIFRIGSKYGCLPNGEV